MRLRHRRPAGYASPPPSRRRPLPQAPTGPAPGAAYPHPDQVAAAADLVALARAVGVFRPAPAPDYDDVPGRRHD